MFDSFLMKASRLIQELGTLMNCEGDIQSGVGSNEVELADDQLIVPVFFSWCSLIVWVENRCSQGKLVLNGATIGR